MNTNQIWGVIILVILVVLSQPKKEDYVPTDSSQLLGVVDGEVSFYGQDVYKPGASIGTEYVRIIKVGDTKQDLGDRLLNSENLNVFPEAEYKFYYYMNFSKPSTTFYVDVVDYVADVTDSTTEVVGYGCRADSNLTYASLDGSGQVQTATANAIAIGASESKDGKIRLVVGQEECYGMPDAPAGMGNAICFLYDASAISNIELSQDTISVPQSISESAYAIGSTIKCYEFPVIADFQTVEMPFTITSTAVNPTSAHNIKVMTDDLGFDLNVETLSEIYGYTDELGNQLVRDAEYQGVIRLS